ncbi:hypothetical protein SLUN_37670 [Streptomyces lunaelactis]|uniref:Uncharacterized protein n=1 Tax=Streptomyces lunaelactis TaxID=1535768 RepID=A0A2R4TD47_9ACTN|nr:hypothetical protein [Streptomyces lunaelactis]AVZ77052.1 hypothetical protein SLUN_37670 [Streptomyces lunaelactis]NUK89074.1 hypothetical protein [Streptomyces lunaelactis]
MIGEASSTATAFSAATGPHVAARRPRVQVSRAEQVAVVERLLATVGGGHLGLVDVLARDVIAVSDGGSIVAAAGRPIEGADRVGPLLGP